MIEFFDPAGYAWFEQHAPDLYAGWPIAIWNEDRTSTIVKYPGLPDTTLSDAEYRAMVAVDKELPAWLALPEPVRRAMIAKARKQLEKE